MGITDWFVHDLNTEERTLTRDLLSVAIADQEFCEEEKAAILKACEFEDISLVQMMDSIRDKKTGAKVLHSIEEKKRYLSHLVKMMSADGKYRSLELKVIEIIAKKLEVSPVLLLSFILDEIKDGKFSTDEGVNILDYFVKHYLAVGI